ncbi:TetR/AcrR family transcriptional regulator [Pseudonocardiaceae bacterium YIM PH 21723]|nr:TetR/AcrR family transcriptional regulator [Pseudonocardiaceae bacterium YIM PH 21723]
MLPPTTIAVLAIHRHYACSLAIVDKRTKVLAAAVEVLGAGGSRALTHRAVDAAAGMPAGSTSNYFRTRNALVTGVLEYLSEIGIAAIQELAGMPRPVDVAEFARLMAGMYTHLLEHGRLAQVARRVVFTEAAWNAELQAAIGEAGVPFQRLMADWLRSLGAADPEPDARLLMIFLDGLLADRLIHPDSGVDVESAITRFLRGLL